MVEPIDFSRYSPKLGPNQSPKKKEKKITLNNDKTKLTSIYLRLGNNINLHP
jgi:hypothetical protein